MPSVHGSSCGEKVEVGRNFEAYQGKFRGGQYISAGLMQTNALVFSLTGKVPLVCLCTKCLDEVDININPSIVDHHPLIEEHLSIWLPQGCRTSQERRKRTLPRP